MSKKVIDIFKFFFLSPRFDFAAMLFFPTSLLHLYRISATRFVFLYWGTWNCPIATEHTAVSILRF